MSDISPSHDNGTAQAGTDGMAPRTRGIVAGAVDLFVGLADSLHRNILLGLMVLVTTGALLNLSIFEITLIIMLIYVVLLVVAAMTDR